MKNRKYENGTEIINEKGAKIGNVIIYYKIVIARKEKARKTDDCVKYICNVYDSNNNCRGCFVLKETTIDLLMKGAEEQC